MLEPLRTRYRQSRNVIIIKAADANVVRPPERSKPLKLISMTVGCYNEEQNVTVLYDRIKKVFQEHLPNYRYEIIFIDNASTDKTVAVLKQLARNDKNLRIIVNNRNFGSTRSCYHCFLQAKGDGVIPMAADLQDPPELIPEMVRLWEQGEEVIMAVKTESKESWLTSAQDNVLQSFERNGQC